MGQHVGFGLVHQHGKFWEALTQSVGDLPPLFGRRYRVLLDKRGADRGSYHSALAGGHVRQGSAHEMNVAPLVDGVQHFRCGCFQAEMCAGHDELDIIPTTSNSACMPRAVSSVLALPAVQPTSRLARHPKVANKG